MGFSRRRGFFFPAVMAAPERDAVPVPVSVPISVEAVLHELALFELRCDGEDATDKREGKRG